MSGGAYEPQRPALLVGALLANAAFSGVCGAILLLAAAPAGTWLGISEGWILSVLGAGLLAFGAGLLLLARSERPRRTLVLAATASDFAWVVSSAALLLAFPDALSAAGEAAVAGVAVVVGGLGAAQLAGLRKRSHPASPDEQA